MYVTPSSHRADSDDPRDHHAEWGMMQAQRDLAVGAGKLQSRESDDDQQRTDPARP